MSNHDESLDSSHASAHASESESGTRRASKLRDGASLVMSNETGPVELELTVDIAFLKSEFWFDMLEGAVLVFVNSITAFILLIIFSLIICLVVCAVRAVGRNPKRPRAIAHNARKKADSIGLESDT